MRIFKNLTVAGAMLATFFSGIVFYVNLYYVSYLWLHQPKQAADLLVAQLPQFFQVVWGASAIRSGVLLLPLILVQTATSMSAGLITSKTGDYRVSHGVIRRRRRHVLILCALTVESHPRLRTMDHRARLAVDAHAVKLAGPSRRIPSVERRRCRTDIPDLARCHSGVIAPQGYGRRNVSAMHERSTGARTDHFSPSGTRNFIRMMGGTIALAACSAILNNSVQSSMRSAGIAANIISQVVADPTQIQSLQISRTEKDVALLGYSESLAEYLAQTLMVVQPTASATSFTL